MEKFKKALISSYCNRPTQVLPNPLWKSFDLMSQYNLWLDCEHAKVYEIGMWGPDCLMFYWSLNRYSSEFLNTQLGRDLNYAMLHQDYIYHLSKKDFDFVACYFRLKHNLRKIAAVNLPSGYHFCKVDIAREKVKVADFILKCSPGIDLSRHEVVLWTKRKVFDNNFWIWIYDINKERQCALGIADFDPMIKELSLEWIQVLPEYRGRGLSRSLVNEILNRGACKADFATVSGNVDNNVRPEIMYRNCGFRGFDNWWLLKR